MTGVFFQSISQCLLEFDARFVDCLDTADPTIIAALNPFLVHPGKRIRPALVYLVCNALGHSVTHPTHRYAGIVEMIHTASLFHDDVLDNASIRRGQPTAPKQLGFQLSILAGDILYIRALALMNSESDTLRNAVHQTVTTMIEAELIQDFNRFSVPQSSLYETIIRGKTAALIALSGQLGAAVTGDNDLMIRFHRFGEHVGMAFQIIDDLLDWFPEETAGKQPFQDLKEGCITLPLIYLIKAVPTRRAKEIQTRVTNPERACESMTADMCVQSMRTFNIPERVLQTAQQHIETACSILTTIPPSPYRDDLERLARLVIERKQ
ncbi:polyprenyl synthetase family protein [bacterium]|nr:polyprenyl synthetase family protein [candidate division CSSED10-310 bacterium]